ncbi:hypothetical protein BHE74_00026405 [Ensete ventricosum]|uniref:Uncharacterized protein n=1 Tax=Ensete ventricosum TaxID=4639 RepID=A0A444EXE3_ENSVE|nr:hypothetical protein B296_00053778 [Ensete ventricosum]RWW15052.1 hypothetical protein GW17_00021132 [Ensete ventricosum]RWW66229.1 hypothetical protein BHE74_00026405 [Ensete ventricosum]RZR75701.1 hypothetical protein BHM03_00000181 [Ensete ventricosum]
MRSRKAAAGGRRAAASPSGDIPVDFPGFEPVRRSASRRRPSSASASLLHDGPPGLQGEDVGQDETRGIFDGGAAGPLSGNPRSFPYGVKLQCWDKAEKVKGRDPDRWRRDALGNIVFRKLVGCPGCLCHDYDHILPYSKVRP